MRRPVMGDKLLSEISEATGLPENLVSDELNRLVSQAGKDTSDTTLDDLRVILADYVQEVLIKAKDEYSA